LSLKHSGPWLCGEQITLADVRLFPTLIRWEMVYAPLFGCSERPLWQFPKLWDWRRRLYGQPGVQTSCDAKAWRHDYFGALFPLNPGGIVPTGPDLTTLVDSGFSNE
jgi:putative glutathione S-transferase